MAIEGTNFQGYVATLRVTNWRDSVRGPDSVFVTFEDEEGNTIDTDGGWTNLSPSSTFLLPFLDNNVFAAQLGLLKCSLSERLVARILLDGRHFDNRPYIVAIELARGPIDDMIHLQPGAGQTVLAG